MRGTPTTLIVLAYWSIVVAGLSTMLASRLSAISIVVYYAVMPLGALLLWLALGGALTDLGLGPYPGWTRHAVTGAIAAAFIVGAIYTALRAAGWLDTVARPWSWSGLAIGVVAQQLVVATIEELSFRGVVQRLLAAQHGWQRGLLGASALFGLFHLPNIVRHDVNIWLIPVTIVVLALMGVVFGWAFERTGRHLALPVALHFGWNVACFGLQTVREFSFSGPACITGDTGWFPESGLLGALGLAGLGLAVRILTAEPDGTSGPGDKSG